MLLIKNLLGTIHTNDLFTFIAIKIIPLLGALFSVEYFFQCSASIEFPIF